MRFNEAGIPRFHRKDVSYVWQIEDLSQRGGLRAQRFFKGFGIGKLHKKREVSWDLRNVLLNLVFLRKKISRNFTFTVQLQVPYLSSFVFSHYRMRSRNSMKLLVSCEFRENWVYNAHGIRSITFLVCFPKPEILENRCGESKSWFGMIVLRGSMDPRKLTTTAQGWCGKGRRRRTEAASLHYVTLFLPKLIYITWEWRHTICSAIVPWYYCTYELSFRSNTHAPMRNT
jgi:hypothetical protein